MLQEHAANNREIWDRLVESEIAYIQSRQNFIVNCTDRVAIFQKTLHTPAERGTALRLTEYLKTEEGPHQKIGERAQVFSKSIRDRWSLKVVLSHKRIGRTPEYIHRGNLKSKI